MTADADQPGVQRPRFLYPGLVASLALNLLLIAGIATAAWHREHTPPPKSEQRQPGLLGFVSEVAPDRQDAIKAQITAMHEQLKAPREKVRQSWLNANGLLSAEPFDKEKFKAALAAVAEVEAGYKAALTSGLAEIASSLSPEERKLLQSWREKRRPRLLMRSGDQTGEKKTD